MNRERKNLLFDEIPDVLDLPKARLARVWSALVQEELAFEELAPTGRKIKWTRRELLPALFEKAFWVTYEVQRPGVTTPPFLRPGVFQRVLNVVGNPDHTETEIAHLGEVKRDTLMAWLQPGRCITVVNVEHLLMRYAHEDLFDHIDICADVVLKLLPRTEDE